MSDPLPEEIPLPETPVLGCQVPMHLERPPPVPINRTESSNTITATSPIVVHRSLPQHYLASTILGRISELKDGGDHSPTKISRHEDQDAQS